MKGGVNDLMFGVRVKDGLSLAHAANLNGVQRGARPHHVRRGRRDAGAALIHLRRRAHPFLDGQQRLDAGGVVAAQFRLAGGDGRGARFDKGEHIAVDGGHLRVAAAVAEVVAEAASTIKVHFATSALDDIG